MTRARLSVRKSVWVSDGVWHEVKMEPVLGDTVAAFRSREKAVACKRALEKVLAEFAKEEEV